MKPIFSLIIIASLFSAPLAWAQRNSTTRPERRGSPTRQVERRAQNSSIIRLREHLQNQHQQIRRASNAGKISQQELQIYNRKKAQVQKLYQEINADGVINQREEQMLAQNLQELDNLFNRIVHN